jgi:phosphate:Na+ symporter
MFISMATLLAGLGLFFYGLNGLGDHLKELAGPSVRRAVSRLTATKPKAFLVGAAMMLLTQSGTGTVFILVSLISAGLITVAAALPAIIGLNLGGSALIFVATIEVEALVLLAIGLAGIGLNLRRLESYRTILAAVFSACLLLLGIVLIKEGAQPIAASDLARDAITATGGSLLFGLIVGIVLSALTQSSIAVIVVTVAIASAGVFALPQAAMIVFGANIGSSVLTYLLSARLAGRMRQISMFQVAYNLVGGVIIVPLLFVETALDTPILMALLRALGDNTGMQLAIGNAVFNIVPALVLYPLTGPVARLFNRIWPPTLQEDEGKLVFLHDNALVEPDSAVALVACEQRRLVEQLRRLLDLARRHLAGQTSEVALDEQAGVPTRILEGVAEYLDELMKLKLSGATLEYASVVLQNQRTLAALNETVRDLSATVARIAPEGRMSDLAGNVIEAVDAALMVLDDMLAGTADDFDRALWEEITAGRSETMRRIRERYLEQEAELPHEERHRLLSLTNLCERYFWLAGQMRIDETLPARPTEATG